MPPYWPKGDRRTPSFCDPVTSETLSRTSRRKRILFSTEPPYLSVLWLEPSSRNWSIRWLLAACSSTPWNLASVEFRAALAKLPTSRESQEQLVCGRFRFQLYGR